MFCKNYEKIMSILIFWSALASFSFVSVTPVFAMENQRCNLCKGIGRCPSCNGTGSCQLCFQVGTIDDNGRKISCLGCHGHKTCSACFGSRVCKKCKGNSTHNQKINYPYAHTSSNMSTSNQTTQPALQPCLAQPSSCQTGKGNGSIKLCTLCRGQKNITNPCLDCQGTGSNLCTFCEQCEGGAKKLSGGQTCTNCKGYGFIEKCTQCKGSKQISNVCTQCKGTGSELSCQGSTSNGHNGATAASTRPITTPVASATSTSALPQPTVPANNSSTSSTPQPAGSTTGTGWFSGWKNTCKNLPTPIIQVNGIMEMVRTFKECMLERLLKSAHLPIDEALMSQLLSQMEDHQGHENLFPFVQKIINPANQNTQVLCLSDIHGDIHALNSFIDNLIKVGTMNENLNITDSKTRIIFQGDYVDCGQYGLEVLYLIMRIVIQNKDNDNIVVIRGNHESRFTNEKIGAKYYTLGQELTAKYGKEGQKLQQLKEAIYQAYDYMPVAAYIGVQDPTTKNYNYTLHSHAFIELGFNPVPLLHAPAEVKYTFIPQWLPRKQVLTNILTKLGKKDQPNKELQKSIKFTIDTCGWDDSTPAWKNITEILFCYGDLRLEPEKTMQQITIQKGNNAGKTKMVDRITFGQISKTDKEIKAFGPSLTSGILDYYNELSIQKATAEKTPAHLVCTLVRGHQHVPFRKDNNQMPCQLFSALHQRNGIVPLRCYSGAFIYCNQQEVVPVCTLPYGSVIQLWSSPNNTTFNGSSLSYEWQYQSAASIIMTPDFALWKIVPLNVPGK